jgi:hypothetical protein
MPKTVAEETAMMLHAGIKTIQSILLNPGVNPQHLHW